jgi:hypothetical protein
MLNDVAAMEAGRELGASLKETLTVDEGIKTIQSLVGLGSSAIWTKDQETLADLFAKRIDISGKLARNYNEKHIGIKRFGSIDESKAKELTSTVLYRALFLEMSRHSSVPMILKRYNVLFKALAIAEPDWLKKGSVGRENLETCYQQTLRGLPNLAQYPGFSIAAGSANEFKIKSAKEEKVLPITVLFYEGPIARAYLETIHNLGLRPQRIINLVSEKDVATGKPIGQWLPQMLRKRYAYGVQRQKIHFWPNKLRRSHSGFVNTIQKSVSSCFSFPEEAIRGACDLKPLAFYGDAIENVLIDSLSDDRLLKYLNDFPSEVILFTGGGIVPRKILGIEGTRFLHIHPGYLPYIRGADCTLWSHLINDHFSASCFFMAPGIDTGDIVFPSWLPKLRLPEYRDKLDSATYYRAVFSFIDPWVRAYVLRRVLLDQNSFNDMEAVSQKEEDGVTFHFMSPPLKEASLGSLFKITKNSF